MSSAQNKPHQSPKSASPPKSQADDQAPSVSQPPLSKQNMDQPLDSLLLETPPAPSIPSEVMSSTETTDSTPNKSPDQPTPPSESAASAAKSASSSTDSTPDTNSTTEETISQDNVAEATEVNPPASSAGVSNPTTDAAPTNKTAPSSTQAEESSAAESAAPVSMALRQQPIPPASEPMQYRAIGLVRGKYVPSEEQFTRGMVETDDGVAIGAVLLGRVMSLVKKHLDLEQSHLWVVYPRTREKGDTDLHVQIVGVWEPEKLNRLDSESAFESDDDVDPEATTEEEDLQDEETAAEVETMTATASSEDFDDLDDRYFSVRGEVVYQSVEDKSLMVKIRRMPRPGSTESKAFKVVLEGVLEGKAVGYFWDLNVQRQGNVLVVLDGTMIGLVPPQKRDKSSRGRGPGSGRPPFRRSGPGAGKPGAARKPWSGGSREGQPRPSRPGDRDRSSAPPNPNRPASGSKPVLKRRKDNPETEG